MLKRFEVGAGRDDADRQHSAFEIIETAEFRVRRMGQGHDMVGGSKKELALKQPWSPR
jgi:hypothetical protein